MKVFVYYHDDYPDNAGIGLEECSSREEAITFIEERMRRDSSRTIDQYTVIEGNELSVKAIDVVSKIQLL